MFDGMKTEYTKYIYSENTGNMSVKFNLKNKDLLEVYKIWQLIKISQILTLSLL